MEVVAAELRLSLLCASLHAVRLTSGVGGGWSLCRYECVKVLDIPGGKGEARFKDYSAMDMMRDAAGRDILMVASQVLSPALAASSLFLFAGHGLRRSAEPS